jgi:Ribosomal protein L24
MAKIKKGDLVQVISGKSQARGGDRGKQGKVLEVLAEQDRVLVDGVNFVSKHIKVGQSLPRAQRQAVSRPTRHRFTFRTCMLSTRSRRNPLVWASVKKSAKKAA